MQTHGLSIGVERLEQQIFVSLKAVGKLTHDDYQLMIPLLESALNQVERPHIDVLFDASEWQGWELQAAWDDFKFGLKHGKEFNKIAVVGAGVSSESWLATVASWFVSGEVRFFDTRLNALAWLDNRL
ncbi:STAS/SEC14 domain-containing protein [Pseudoalteromonas fenneropenaei]|uniref:STAS/SEC14 domain-containing protein n=1 Tax=Pseudoalteromonas fenneropenaei TaxID=1737459 RepID=A0ABV7CIQ0_9GAMM